MTDRRAAQLAGTLFIAATVALSFSVATLEPVLESSDLLPALAGNPRRVSAGVLLELVNHVSVVGIAVVLHPILRRASGERVAMGYVAARSVEAVLFVTATTNLLDLATLARRVGGAGLDRGAAGLELLSSTLLAGHDWNVVTLPFVAFALGSLLLNVALFRHRTVPRWLSGWGLLAAASNLLARLLLIGGVTLDSATVVAMDAPIFAQEMVFAVWLIAWGVSEPQTAGETEEVSRRQQTAKHK